MKKRRVVSLVAAASLLMVNGAYAAIPGNTVILGDKAYHIDLLFEDSYNAQIQTALVEAGDALYYDFNDEGFRTIFGNQFVTDAEKTQWPEITRLDEHGDETRYEAGTQKPIGDAELAVESVSAINITKIKVDFTNEAADFTTDNISAAGLVFSNPVLADDKKSVIVTVDGAQFESSYDVTVTGVKNAEGVVAPDYTESVTFGTVNQYYQIKFTFDAEDTNENEVPDIPATGATNVQVTAKVYDLEDNPVDTTGVIRFMTTRGGIAQAEKTLQNGEAAIQLTSEASLDETVYASISATIVGDYALEGLTGTSMVEFLAPDEVSGPNQAVPVVNVESNQADRFFVTLGQGKPGLTDSQLDDIAAAIIVTDGIQGQLGTAPLAPPVVKEVKQVSDKVLEVILNSDEDETYYLTDNAKHFVEFQDVNNVITKGNRDFVITDTTKQFVLDVDAVNQRELIVTFSESVAWSTDALVQSFDANNPANYLIDGEPLNDTPWDAFELSSDRKKVTINLGANDMLISTDNNIEISNVGDWAGKTDSNNCISTQLISFAPVIDDTKPAISITRQSPEQFVVEFNTNVQLSGAASLEEAISIYYDDGDGIDGGNDGILDTRYDIDQNPTNGTQGITFQAYDGDANVTAGVAGGASFNKILLELEEDWTQEDGTGSFAAAGSDYTVFSGIDAYWVNANPLQFVIDADAFKNMLGNKTEEVKEYVANPRDRMSPDIVLFTQDKDADDNYLGTATVVMSEPVQVVGVTSPKTTPNPEQFVDNNDVPAGEITFEKDGVVVQGVVASVSDDDFTLTIQPDDGTNTGFAALKAATANAAGTWIVNIIGITDDYGNAMATDEFTFEVPEDGVVVPTEVEPEVMYAEYRYASDYDFIDDQSGAYDVIRVKFTEKMLNAGAKAVSDTTNYLINGDTLADLGSSIRKGIAGITDEWDGITILLPKDTLSYDANFVLNMASNLESADGEMLVSGTNELDFTTVAADVYSSDYTPGVLVTNWSEKVSNVAVDASNGDPEKLGDDALDDIEITFTDIPVAGDIKQVRVNGQVIDAANLSVVAPTLTVNMHGHQVNYAAGDRVHVTINGQTIYVETN